MATSDPLDLLLKHDKWATRQIIEACRGLSEEQFHRKFEMGPGSLHDTLSHIFAAMQIWTDTLSGRERRKIETVRRTVDDLIAHQEVVLAEYEPLARLPVTDILNATRNGKTYRLTRGTILTHVATHAMHHRAQCLNMLRHVGAKLPPSSVVEWVREGNDEPIEV